MSRLVLIAMFLCGCTEILSTVPAGQTCSAAESELLKCLERPENQAEAERISRAQGLGVLSVREAQLVNRNICPQERREFCAICANYQGSCTPIE